MLDSDETRKVFSKLECYIISLTKQRYVPIYPIALLKPQTNFFKKSFKYNASMLLCGIILIFLWRRCSLFQFKRSIAKCSLTSCCFYYCVLFSPGARHSYKPTYRSVRLAYLLNKFDNNNNNNRGNAKKLNELLQMPSDQI